MYSAGEEFEKTNSEGDVEEYTCLSNITVGDKEYLVCDSETGEKKVFYYDSIEEELYDLDEDEDITVLTRIICTGTKILASMIKMRM